MLMFQGKLKTLYFMDITVSILTFFFQVIGPLSEDMKFLEVILDYSFLVKHDSYTSCPSENIFYLQKPPKNVNILKPVYEKADGFYYIICGSHVSCVCI